MDFFGVAGAPAWHRYLSPVQKLQVSGWTPQRIDSAGWLLKEVKHIERGPLTLTSHIWPIYEFLSTVQLGRMSMVQPKIMKATQKPLPSASFLAFSWAFLSSTPETVQLTSSRVTIAAMSSLKFQLGVWLMLRPKNKYSNLVQLWCISVKTKCGLATPVFFGHIRSNTSTSTVQVHAWIDD